MIYNEFPSTGLPILQASQVTALCVIETGLFKTVAVMPWKAPQVGINLNHFANHPWKDAGRKYLQLRRRMLDSQFKHFPKSWWLTEVECGSTSKMTIFLMFMGRFSVHVPPFWRLIPTKHGDSTQVQNRIKVEPPSLVKADGWKGRPYHRVSLLHC